MNSHRFRVPYLRPYFRNSLDNTSVLSAFVPSSEHRYDTLNCKAPTADDFCVMRGTENRRNTRVFQDFATRAAPKSGGVGDVGPYPVSLHSSHCDLRLFHGSADKAGIKENHRKA